MPATSQAAQRNPWQRRLRRLLWMAGAATTIYLVTSYTFDRLRAARIRTLKDKAAKDRIRAHFTTLLSTISFTVYALLPTLQPQLFDAYPVEHTSQALQGMSGTLSSGEGPTPSSSLMLQNVEAPCDAASSQVAPSDGQPGESWASEFRRKDRDEALSPTMSSVPTISEQAPPSETDDGVSSVLSQSISLPPTDASSSSPSPPSDLSRSAILQPSPPRPNVTVKSKKELWRDLKIQSMTRALATAYLLPLLYLLTTSQLAILARRRYMAEVKSEAKASSRPSEATFDPLATPRAVEPSKPASGLLGYLSNATAVTSILQSRPVSIVTSFIPFFPSMPKEPQSIFDFAEAEDERQSQQIVDDEETARVFLTYSWWLLHEGWTDVSSRVEQAVKDVLGGVPLKRGLSVTDWEALVKEIRAKVETDSNGLDVSLHDFAQHVLPPDPLPSVPGCPLPSTPEGNPTLCALLDEARSHVASPDARFLLGRGVTTMTRVLFETLSEKLYSEATKETAERRLVDCLPEFNSWSKSAWEGIPDKGVETLLGIKEFESLAALIFGDWAGEE